MSDCIECAAIEDLKLRASEFFGEGGGSQIGKSLVIKTAAAQAVLQASIGNAMMPSNYVTVSGTGPEILGIDGARRLFSFDKHSGCNVIQLQWLNTCQDFTPIDCEDTKGCDLVDGETLDDECRTEQIKECKTWAFSINEADLHCLERDDFMRRASAGLNKMLKSADEYIGRFILDKVAEFAGDARYDENTSGIGLDENGYIQIHPTLLDCNGDSINCLVNYFTNMLDFNKSGTGNSTLIGGAMFSGLKTSAMLNGLNDNQRNQTAALNELPNIVIDVTNFQGEDVNCAYLIENRSLAFIGLNYYDRQPRLIKGTKEYNDKVVTRISSPTLTISASVGGANIPFEYDLSYSARCIGDRPTTYAHVWNLSATYDLLNAPTCEDNVTGIYKLIKTCDAPLDVCEVSANLCESVIYNNTPVDVSVPNEITIPANPIAVTGTGGVTATITDVTANITKNHAYGEPIASYDTVELATQQVLSGLPSNKYFIRYTVTVEATDGVSTTECKKVLHEVVCVGTCEPPADSTGTMNKQSKK